MGEFSKAELKKIYFGIDMKKHLIVEIQVGVNEGENWHLVASLETEKEKELIYRGKTVWWAWKQKWISVKENNTTKEFNTLY